MTPRLQPSCGACLRATPNFQGGQLCLIRHKMVEDGDCCADYQPRNDMSPVALQPEPEQVQEIYEPLPAQPETSPIAYRPRFPWLHTIISTIKYLLARHAWKRRKEIE